MSNDWYARLFLAVIAAIAVLGIVVILWQLEW